LHIFLQGPRNIGKSTVILKTLDIISGRSPIALGGFFTWNSGGGDGTAQIFLRPAAVERRDEISLLASFDAALGRMACNLDVFEKTAVRLLAEGANADLIIMDELGFLETDAPFFRKAVHDRLAWDVPVLGVLRQGKDIPWHADIKNSPSVKLFDVTQKNRDALPQELARLLMSR